MSNFSTCFLPQQLHSVSVAWKIPLFFCCCCLVPNSHCRQREQSLLGGMGVRRVKFTLLSPRKLLPRSLFWNNWCHWPAFSPGDVRCPLWGAPRAHPFCHPVGGWYPSHCLFFLLKRKWFRRCVFWPDISNTAIFYPVKYWEDCQLLPEAQRSFMAKAFLAQEHF